MGRAPTYRRKCDRINFPLDSYFGAEMTPVAFGLPGTESLLSIGDIWRLQRWAEFKSIRRQSDALLHVKSPRDGRAGETIS